MVSSRFSIFLIAFCAGCFSSMAQSRFQTEEVAPGVIKLSFGQPDEFAPYQFCTEKPRQDALRQMPSAQLPFLDTAIRMELTARGVQVRVPLTNSEQLYGFGMQVGSFQQRGMKRKPIVNDHPVSAIGFTHAPQPFYVSTEGYGVLVNSSRYVNFLCGSNQELLQQGVAANSDTAIRFTTEELYAQQSPADGAVWIDIPNARGVELFIFTGPTLRHAVQRYNLFSGGGALPPLWGLGIKYRVKGDFDQPSVMQMARYFREAQIPCDVLGLEPGWHSNSYSCSYVWSQKFPQPQQLIDSLKQLQFRLNLWEHAYVNPHAPFYSQLKERAGNFLVWRGLVPDFADPAAAQIFADYHEKTFVDNGIASFKLDECDNSNIIDGKATWGFPDMTRFPSGIDGEQMHQVFGVLYAQTLYQIYKKKNQRTYFDYRASGVFTSSLPAVLYSDIYGHQDYINMIATSSFGGLLWSPELRDSKSELDFVRRLQTILLAPQSVVDAWFLKNTPWFQLNRELNNKDIRFERSAELETLVRSLFEERMKLIPYLYSSFADYHFEGTPPFRALVMDYPDDTEVRRIANQFMIGPSLMAAPTTADSSTRTVYFPEGVWYDYYTHKTYQGGKRYQIEQPRETLPLFVKSGSIIPLAQPVQQVDANTRFRLTCRVFGKDAVPFRLMEDDGLSFDFEKGNFNQVWLRVKNGKGRSERIGSFENKRYEIIKWEFIQ